MLAYRLLEQEEEAQAKVFLYVVLGLVLEYWKLCLVTMSQEVQL